MRQFIAALMVVGCVTAQAAESQGRAGAAGSGRIDACSLLPKELVAKYYSGNKRLFETETPHGEPLGKEGSDCGYGGIQLQVDPFPADRVADLVKKDWIPTSGVGDRAYFRNNGDRFAELIIISGPHVITIQMDVPNGKTAEATKPDTIALAKEILPKVK